MKKLSLLLLLSVFVFCGCSDDDDTKTYVLSLPITKLIHLIWAIKKIRMIHGLLVATGGQLTTNIIY